MRSRLIPFLLAALLALPAGALAKSRHRKGGSDPCDSKCSAQVQGCFKICSANNPKACSSKCTSQLEACEAGCGKGGKKHRR